MSFVVPKLLLNMIYEAIFTAENTTSENTTSENTTSGNTTFWPWCVPDTNTCELKVIVNGKVWAFCARKDTVDQMFRLVRAVIQFARPSMDLEKCEAYTSAIQFVNLNFVLRIPGSANRVVVDPSQRNQKPFFLSKTGNHSKIFFF